MNDEKYCHSSALRSETVEAYRKHGEFSNSRLLSSPSSAPQSPHITSWNLKRSSGRCQQHFLISLPILHYRVEPKGVTVQF